MYVGQDRNGGNNVNGPSMVGVCVPTRIQNHPRVTLVFLLVVSAYRIIIIIITIIDMMHLVEINRRCEQIILVELSTVIAARDLVPFLSE
jgi:hypothetical protein